MLGMDHRAARYAWTAAAVLLLLVLVYRIRSTLFIFILALLFAYLLAPLVNLLDRWLPASRTRTPALGLAYLIFIGMIVAAGVLIVPSIVDQATALKQKFPGMVASWEEPAPSEPGAVTSIKVQILEKIRTEVAQRSNDVIGALPAMGLRFLAMASDLIYVVVIPILAFFFLKDGAGIRDHLLDMVDAGPQRAFLDDVMADINILLAHYMRALVLLSLCTFTAYSIFFAILGVPYGILLAALACLLEFIPMIGPLTASVTILLVGGLAGAPVLTILVFLGAYRMFQDYVLSPHLMGQGVELHPLLILFGVFAGAELAGIAGTFLSVPTLALVRILYLRIRRARLRDGVPVVQ